MVDVAMQQEWLASVSINLCHVSVRKTYAWILDFVSYNDPRRFGLHGEGIETISVWRILEVEVLGDMRNCIGCIGVIELARAITLREMSVHPGTSSITATGRGVTY